MQRLQVVYCLIETAQVSSSDDSTSSSSIHESSTSSNESWTSNDDDENYLLLPLMRHLIIGYKRHRVEEYLTVVESWTDLEFKEHLRLPKNIAYQLIGELELSEFIPNNSFGMRPIAAKLSFLIFLWFVANTEPLCTMADRFDVSISSTFRVIRRILSWVLTKLNDVIKWPQNQNEIMKICDDFNSKKGIPGILGAIDCTHIRIEKPLENEMDYCNRKKYHSINLQAVVDSKMRFTNVYCGEPGSLHDARVLRRSPLYDAATENVETMFPNNMFIIGDSAYPSLPWLVPPFRDNGRLNVQEREFNYLHSSTQITVEKAFAILKGRFRQIKFFSEYRSTKFITDFVIAACILPNYCINQNDILDIFDDNNQADLQDCPEEDNYTNDLNGNIDNINQRDRRRAVFNILFTDM